jgi:hypothetical protein
MSNVTQKRGDAVQTVEELQALLGGVWSDAHREKQPRDERADDVKHGRLVALKTIQLAGQSATFDDEFDRLEVVVKGDVRVVDPEKRQTQEDAAQE